MNSIDRRQVPLQPIDTWKKMTKDQNSKENYETICSVYRTAAESTDHKKFEGPESGYDYVRTEAYDYVMDLCSIEIMVEEILKTKKAAFSVSRHKNGRIEAIELKLGKYFNLVTKLPSRETIVASISPCRYSPNVRLFFDTLASMDVKLSNPYQFISKYSVQANATLENNSIDLLQDKSQTPVIGILGGSEQRLEAEYFNDFIEAIRINSKGKAYLSDLKKRKGDAAKNHKSLTDYINTLLDEDHYSRILVVRVDLTYIKDVKQLVTIDLAKAHREKLLDNRRHKKILNDMIGYAWGLEYGVEKGGYHHHFFFFFDGKKHQEGITIGDAIGRYWCDVITKKTGHYFNCNKQQHKYAYPGIGVINHFDTELRKNLIDVAAPYITKKELFFSLKSESCTQERFKTFSKGEIKKVSPRSPLTQARAGRKRHEG